ncbi:MAG: UvrD-helicase domain-containing protein [Desulfobacula sp.]|jgi:superfamily I DNA/RNA helicase/mRNA-degrading endonuclease RelE of RelBE toxin-antitoxin system|nr:UvrD-helicase domain-containing protein [Desulfobacula sp.]
MILKRKIKVAISSEFMNAFARIPKKMQSKILEFITKFRNNPTSSGIHYENIAQFKDPTLKSVRIDKTYRGIVKKPDSGNVYMLLWVDHHDKAYEWAKNKKCKINPETGSLQVYDVDDSQFEVSKTDTTESGTTQPEQYQKSLFDDVHDRHLLKLGVPLELIPKVRNVYTDEQLDKVVIQLPTEANEALTAIAAGYTLDEVFREFNKSIEKDQKIDTEDFEAALENPDTKQRFFVAEDDLVLQEILKAPLEKWRVFLHPSQRHLVTNNWNGPVRVLGGAGTGKTVVAIHRAKWLVENVYTQKHDKILFTTFTRNLSADIKENLGKICSEKLIRRIEVVNLDRWVSGFLRNNRYMYNIDYGERTKPLWDKAVTLAPSELGLSDVFYREEWERVIQPQSITSFQEYLNASRVGRGTRLTRKYRKAVWTVFEEYRLLLNENNLCEIEDAMRDACALIRDKGDVLPYKAAIVDEAQDMSVQAFKLIRQMIPGGDQQNDLFIAGDAHQRIYRHKIVLGQCGINILGRGRRLKINYRTTEENRHWAESLLKGIKFDDLDGGLDDQKGYKSLTHGVVPQVKNTTSFQNEIEFITQYLEQVKQKSGSLNEICLVARTHNLLKQYEGALKSKGIDTYFIKRSEAENRNNAGVRLATMHRVKGLEFDRVIIAGVNDGIVPLSNNCNQPGDQVIRKENETQERALLYVAATRAKKEVVVTSFGEPSRFIN